ncbi:MAG: hypothetical protein ABSE84_01615, partial [Isosphaeraceae bacterium]
MLATLFLVMPLAAQDAHVVPLSSEDAEMAKRTYEAMKLAETNWKMFQDRISKKYLIVQATDPDASSQHYLAFRDRAVGVDRASAVFAGDPGRA